MKREYLIYTMMVMVLVTAGVWVPAAAAADDLQKQFLGKIDELLPGMGAEKLVDREKPQMAFERICMENSAPDKQAERAALCAAMMERVGPDVALPARVWLLRKVESIGREEVVPRLTELMGDKDPQVRELARRALQNNPVPAAGAALRKELDEAKDAAWRVALINALAFRHDAEAVPQIAKLAADKEAAVANAAISALGSIADEKALAALASLRKEVQAGSPHHNTQGEVADASLRAAEMLVAKGDKVRAASIYGELFVPSATESVRIAAIRGIAAAKGADAVPELLKLIAGNDEHLRMIAGQCVESIPGENVTKQLVDGLADASPDVQAVLLTALGRRGDASALPVVVKYLTASETGPRVAAIGALRYIGNGSNVETLAKAADTSNPADVDAARDSLKWMKGKDVDAAILAMIPNAQSRIKSELVRAAAVRSIKPAYDILLQNTHDPDESVRVAVISAIGKCTPVKNLPKALKAFEKLTGDESLQAAKEALLTICNRETPEEQRAKPLIAAMAGADPSAQVVAIQALVSLRGPAALEALQKYQESKNAEIKQAATQGIAAWDPVYCAQWVYTGPIRKEGLKGDQLYDLVLPPEEPKAKVEWKPLQRGKKDKDPEIDLKPIGKEDNCCAYLQTRVRSKKDQDVVLSFGSDDGMKAWMNGSLVHSRKVSQGFQRDADKVPAKLKQGWNTLLVKVTQNGGAWTFSCGIKAADGGPAKGLKFDTK